MPFILFQHDDPQFLAREAWTEEMRCIIFERLRTFPKLRRRDELRVGNSVNISDEIEYSRSSIEALRTNSSENL